MHLSFGDTPAEKYLRQLSADLLLHGWDLAQATGGDEALPADLVEACARWFDRQEDGYWRAGVIGPRVDVPDAPTPGPGYSPASAAPLLTTPSSCSAASTRRSAGVTSRR